MTTVSINFGEQELILLPEKAIWWQRESAILLSDVHLGKGEIFRRHGVAIPAGHSAADLAQITELVERWSAHRLIILGDLIHGPPGASLLEGVAEWRDRLRALEVTLVTGNHDRYLPLIPPQWRVGSTPSLDVSGLHLAHEPSDCVGQPEIVGHIHPAVRLRAGRSDSLRVPVFWLQPDRLVLPAFGSFTGGYTVSPGPRDRVFAVGPDEVVEVGS